MEQNNYMTIIGIDGDKVGMTFDYVTKIYQIIKNKNKEIKYLVHEELFKARNADEINKCCSNELFDILLYNLNKKYLEVSFSSIENMIILLKDAKTNTPYAGIIVFYNYEEDDFCWYTFDYEDEELYPNWNLIKTPTNGITFDFDFGFLGDKDE